MVAFAKQMTEGWERSKEHYRNDRGNLLRLHPPVSFADRKINVRYRALDLTEVSPGHFDPLAKEGPEVVESLLLAKHQKTPPPKPPFLTHPTAPLPPGKTPVTFFGENRDFP